jgi:hypothetical protein
MLKKIVRWILFVVACLVTFVALFYAEEDWRGKRAWDTYQREREANGDSFEWSSVVAPPVPDSENFATTPLFAELFPKPPEHPRLNTIALPAYTNVGGNWHTGRMEDLSAWQACFTNADLLAALSRYEPILREISEASHRPYCRFPIRYEDGVDMRLPHLNPIRNLAQVYRLRALAELAVGNTDAASEDVQMCLRLADKLKDEPVLISFLVRAAVLDLAAQPVWEGIVAHRWNESQLAALQVGFEQTDPSASFVKAMRGERLCNYYVICFMREHPSQSGFVNALTNEELSPTNWLDHAVPSGWLYQNQLVVDRFYSGAYLPLIDQEHQRIDPQMFRTLDRSTESMRKTPYNVMRKLLLADLGRAANRLARTQTSVDEPAVACALERYRLVHGQLPDTLPALVPEFLASVPHDVIDGEPLRYRRLPDGQYVLYSIGWNGVDDGGQIAFTGTGNSRHQDFNQGDWVWFSQPQPRLSASAAK